MKNSFAHEGTTQTVIIGIPCERKEGESRVAFTPSGVETLIGCGHEVLMETEAGKASGFSDHEYEQAGATVLAGARGIWSAAELIVKVKEPIPEEWEHLRPDLALFAYLHLAADEALTTALVASGVTAIAYETVEGEGGGLPLLAPMSEVAGRLAPQAASHCLELGQGGSGSLLGGVSGVAPARVTILGGGTVGTNAARIALGMGADVTIVDRNVARLRYLSETLPGAKTAAASNAGWVRSQVRSSDVVIGAALVPGARAPRLVTREDIAEMSPGSVVVDVAIDQGGCFETSRVTTHSDPTYIVDGVVHYCVSNMPALVPRTATLALTNATFEHVLALADRGTRTALRAQTGLSSGLNIAGGKIVHPAIAAAFGKRSAPAAVALRAARKRTPREKPHLSTTEIGGKRL